MEESSAIDCRNVFRSPPLTPPTKKKKKNPFRVDHTFYFSGDDCVTPLAVNSLSLWFSLHTLVRLLIAPPSGTLYYTTPSPLFWLRVFWYQLMFALGGRWPQSKFEDQWVQRGLIVWARVWRCYTESEVSVVCLVAFLVYLVEKCLNLKTISEISWGTDKFLRLRGENQWLPTRNERCRIEREIACVPIQASVSKFILKKTGSNVSKEKKNKNN